MAATGPVPVHSEEYREKVQDFMDAGGMFEYEGIWLPRATSSEIMKQLKNFEVRTDDLVLATYPKCGTHWIAEVLHLMEVDGYVDKIARDFELHAGLEFGLPHDPNRTFQDVISAKASPRFYMTHLPAKFLPPQMWTKKPKIVYLTRDPKDTCTSLYRFINAVPMGKEPFTWESTFNMFISEHAPFGTWFDHALGYWEHRNDENVFFLTYEEMKKDLSSVVRRLEKFLGLTVTPEGMERILEHSSVEGMKKTYAKIEEDYENGKMYTRAFGIMPFIQKGVSGGWKNQFTDEQRDQIERLIKEKLSGTGLDVHYH